MASASVRGHAGLNYCTTKASCLLFDVYERANRSIPADMVHRVVDAKNRWDRIFTTSEPQSGYCANFYGSQGSEADRRSGKVCPPALVFRGSDMTKEELSGIAASIDIKYYLDISSMKIWGSEKELKPFFKVLSADRELKTLEHLIEKGFEKTDVSKEEKGNIRFPILLGGRGISMYSPMVNVHFVASVAIWTKDKGDWATNIRQGLGLKTTQYNLLAKADTERAGEIAMSEWGGRLIILGHSLGGGLASLAACIVQKMYPTLHLTARTFNAAGLNSGTAAQCQTTLGAANIQSYAVQSEILTSLQKQPRSPLPLFAHILRWSEKKMSDAISTVSEVSGPKKLTALWPLSGDEFGHLTALERMASHCNNLREFVEMITYYLFSKEFGSSYSVRLASISNEFNKASSIFLESIDRHLLDAVAETFPDHFKM